MGEKREGSGALGIFFTLRVGRVFRLNERGKRRFFAKTRRGPGSGVTGLPMWVIWSRVLCSQLCCVSESLLMTHPRPKSASPSTPPTASGSTVGAAAGMAAALLAALAFFFGGIYEKRKTRRDRTNKPGRNHDDSAKVCEKCFF